MTEILDATFLDNTIYQWLAAAIAIALLFLALKAFKSVIFRRLTKWASGTSTTWDGFLLGIIETSVFPVLYISIVYFSLQTLAMPAKITSILHGAYMVAVTYYAVKAVIAAFRKFVFSFIRRDEDGESKEKQAGGLIAIVSIIIWMLGIVFLMDNMGYNVTTIVAGLGVGGIAIALAAQAVLGDLFSYFVIFFDRPFEIGDYVAVGEDSGIVEYIGIKTTRIRTLGGEQLVCSNTDLTNSRLHNFKRMQRRRVVFKIGVTYATAGEQLEAIPAGVGAIISSQEKATFDRGHFAAFGDSSLDFEFVYHVEDPDYAAFMDTQQSIYLAIFRDFERLGIAFAYPTRTLQIEAAGPESLKNSGLL